MNIDTVHLKNRFKKFEVFFVNFGNSEDFSNEPILNVLVFYSQLSYIFKHCLLMSLNEYFIWLTKKVLLTFNDFLWKKAGKTDKLEDQKLNEG